MWQRHKKAKCLIYLHFFFFLESFSQSPIQNSSKRSSIFCFQTQTRESQECIFLSRCKTPKKQNQFGRQNKHHGVWFDRTGCCLFNFSTALIVTLRILFSALTSQMSNMTFLSVNGLFIHCLMHIISFSIQTNYRN